MATARGTASSSLALCLVLHRSHEFGHTGAGSAGVPLSWEQSLSLGPCREQESSAGLQSRAVAGGAARTAVFSVPS